MVNILTKKIHQFNSKLLV